MYWFISISGSVGMYLWEGEDEDEDAEDKKGPGKRVGGAPIDQVFILEDETRPGLLGTRAPRGEQTGLWFE